MAKNKVQFQRGLSLPQFLKQYGTEEHCHNALFNWRWPTGFICPECGHVGYCEIAGRGVYQCHRCHRQTSLTSGHSGIWQRGVSMYPTDYRVSVEWKRPGVSMRVYWWRTCQRHAGGLYLDQYDDW